MTKPGVGKTVCIIAVFCLATAAAQGQTFKTLVTFTGQNGGNSFAPLTQGTDGNLYGTTNGGGTGSLGTAFKITPAGALTTLYNFCSQTNCSDGENTDAPLMQAGNGNFYGTTTGGGGGPGGGTAFQLTTKGKLTTLHDFCFAAPCTDGSQPNAGLIEGIDESLYGTTLVGGPPLSGTVFKMTLGGTVTTLYSFCSLANCADGSDPKAALVQGTTGNFFGATTAGGVSSNCPYSYGCGTMFEITTAGKLTTLHNFCFTKGCLDGFNPGGTLIQASDGNLYGTAYQGGNAADGGTIYRFTPPGKFATIYRFCAQLNCADGSKPAAGLIEGSDGNFYGTTISGGAHNSGTIFEITPGGVLTTLYSFCSQSNCTDGSYPASGLVQSTNGTFYGTTQSGGILADCFGGCGTVFSFSTGLGPFVAARPNTEKVGKTVSILGNNLTGATSVTFNGTPATFTVVSSTFIKATVPTGAISGTIQVTAPGGTLSSNVPFNVE